MKLREVKTDARSNSRARALTVKLIASKRRCGVFIYFLLLSSQEFDAAL